MTAHTGVSMDQGIKVAAASIRGEATTLLKGETGKNPLEDEDYEQVNGVTRKRVKTTKPAETKLQADSENNLFDTDGKWGTKAAVPEQESLFPDTVRMADVVTELFDLGEETDRKRYSAFFSQILARERVPIREIPQAPDAGKMNFRLLIVHGRREFMNITPR